MSKGKGVMQEFKAFILKGNIITTGNSLGGFLLRKGIR